MRVGLVLILLSFAGAANAQTVGPPKISITIYNSSLALVEERRSVDMPAGRNRLEFKGVSAQIRPETVALSAPDVRIAVPAEYQQWNTELKPNHQSAYDSDMFSKGSL